GYRTTCPENTHWSPFGTTTSIRKLMSAASDPASPDAKEMDMPNLLPSGPLDDLTPTVGVGRSVLGLPDRRTSRALSNLERHTIVRMASVQGHALVQNEKLHEVDRLSREAMSGQAMLSRWG